MQISAYTHVDLVPFRRIPNVKKSVLETLRYMILQKYNETPLSILYNEVDWSTETITEEELPSSMKCESQLRITMSVQSY